MNKGIEIAQNFMQDFQQQLQELQNELQPLVSVLDKELLSIEGSEENHTEDSKQWLQACQEQQLLLQQIEALEKMQSDLQKMLVF